MACKRRRDDNGYRPHFFKIILPYHIQHGKLGIPKKFMKKYGQDLSEQVFLKVPNGGVWQVELKRGNGEVWMEKGWQQFVQFYSLQPCHLLVFRYEGKSNFHVLIFNKSASEIEYPLRNCISTGVDPEVHSGRYKMPRMESELEDKSKEVAKKEGNGKTHKFAGESSKVPQIQEIEHDVSLEILDDVSLRRVPRNMTKRNGVNVEKQKRKPDSINGSNECFKDTVMKPLAGPKKQGALQMASSFKSKNPFFMVLMHPTYVLTKYNLNIPANVTEKYFLRDHGYISLLVSNGGSWRVKYIRYNSSSHNKTFVQFSSGWKVFVQDNKLVVGDVCVFEMINGSELSLQVVIFRACEVTNSHQWIKRPRLEETDDVSVEVLEKSSVYCPGPQKMSIEPRGTQSNGVMLEKPKRKLDLNSKQDLADKGLGGCIASGHKRLKFGIPKARRVTSFSYTEKARALQMASSVINPETPFFMVLMQPSYVISGSRLVIPNKFVDQYFPEKNHGEINLLISNDRTWHVKYRSRSSEFISGLVEFTSGWKEFMEENNLEVGDVCVFELIKGTKFSLKVTIFRFHEYASDNSERMKVCETKEPEDDFSLCKKELKTSMNCLQPYKITRTKSKGTQVDGLPLKKPIKHLNISSMNGLAGNLRLLTYHESNAEYSSEYPFFIRTMRGSYLDGNLCVPRKFAEMYIKERSRSVHLQVAKESWNVQSHIYKDGSCKFCLWSAFAKANSLRGGDVCMFELIKRNDMLFKVSIIRYLDAKVKN